MINVMRSPINVGFVSANGINPCEMGSETNSHDKHHVLIASEKMPKELSAVWVKQNGYWYPAVRCSDSDYPFTILKAMPISENNQYVLIYFIHTQSLCWANVLLVCSIDAKPEPLGFGSHESAYELVKRMSMSQHYMIEILASYILSITEKLHIEVVIETERDVKKWIELTNDAHSAKSYCSLGKILLKLHSMISDGYIKRLWREESFISWKQKCETVQNAKNIELLTQELLDSIVWEKVAKLFDSSIESEMDKEWKAWKEDNRMLFSASKRLFTFNILEDTYKTDVEMDSMVTERRKRQKLEIRRGEIRNLDGTESHEYHMPASSEKHNTSVLADKELIAASQVTSLRSITENINSVENDSPPSQCHNNDGNSQSLVDSSTVEMKVYSLSEVKDNKKRSSNEHRYLQCAAFIEAKDKQCGRWASEGDIYCCVHSHFHSGEKALKKDLSKSVPETAICEGMTVHGRRCSHRCQSGSSFCKKHFTQDDKMVIVSSSEETLLERKAAGLSFDEGSIHSSINVQHQILGDVVERLVENGDNSNGLNMRPQQLYNQSQGTLMEKRSSNVRDSNHAGSLLRCLGWCRNNSGQCSHKSKPGSSFCEKHLPCSDNNAGKTSDRYITVELRNELIKNANSKEDKFYVGRAVDLLNEYMNVYFLEGTHYKSKSKARMLDWLIEEVSKDIKSAEALLKVVSDEKTKLAKELAVEGLLTLTNAVIHLSDPVGQHDDTCENKLLKCKLCRMGFSNSYFLGQHWISNHEKEAQSFLRGSCHLCKTQFRDKTDIENHVKSHHVDVLGSCPIISCMYCSNAVMDYDNLWKHVLEDHINDFIQSIDNLNELTYTDSSLIMEGGRCLQTEIVIQDYPTASTMSVMRERGKDLKNHNSAHKYTCRFCGLKFRLLPDLGRHHQAEHMDNSTDKSRCLKRKWKTNHQNSESLPKDMSFKGMGNGNANDNKLLNDSNCVMNFLEIGGSSGMPTSSENDKPNDNYCLAMAEMLIPDVQKTKPCPNNKELLSCARKACCKHKFNALLKETYGPLPDRLYRKAARLCSEANIIVEWHNENFICPKNCKQEYSQKSAMLTTLNNISNDSSSLLEKSDEFKTVSNNIYVEEWDKAENHVILTLCDMENRWHAKTIVICEDLSFGTEAVPIPCVIDEHSLDGFAFAILKEGKQLTLGMFMQNFCYITERRLDPSLGLDTKSSQLGCTCTESRCSAGSCDHVYLFDNDNDDAEDIFGHPMHGRFPYDGNGRIILEEGYLVYECNSLCTCNETCPNRVLQKGVQVKLEVYKTKRKGWAVRAAQKISRGTFICEYLGEVLNDQEANKRGERYDKEGCSYLYDIDAHIDTNELIDGMKPFVIDATKYGNVARFINHSCCPNLVNYQVLVESMDCQLAHIGLYASRDIAIGEELAYDYRYKLLPGDGCPCQCGARNCRGRLY